MNDLGRERLGSVLRGKYRLDSVLGRGGMAVVYSATHRNQKRFAVKILHPELSVREDMRKRFVREGYVANTVKHPGAVAMLDDDVAEDGAAFLVMELLDGHSVEDVWEVSGQQLAVEVVLAIAHQVLDVLSAAHGKTIVHRDIKPANLFVTREGAVKVLDFGIARLKEAAYHQNATTTGAMLGTPAFMAPEQALAELSQIDAQTDLWSVGATMFTLLSGRLVHEAPNAQQVVIITATRPASSLSTVAPQLDPRIVALVDRALAFTKVDRWGSAREMRDAIAALHVALYGVPVGSGILASLITAVDASSVGTERTLPAGAHHDSTLASAKTVSSLTSDFPHSGSPPAPGLKTTANPVSSVAGVPRRRATGPIVAAAGVVVVGLACVAALVGVRSGGGSSTSSPSTAAGPSLEPASHPAVPQAASATVPPPAPLASPEPTPPATAAQSAPPPPSSAMTTPPPRPRRPRPNDAPSKPSAPAVTFDPASVR